MSWWLAVVAIVAMSLLGAILSEVRRAAGSLDRLDQRLRDIEYHVLYIQNESLRHMQASVESVEENTRAGH